MYRQAPTEVAWVKLRAVTAQFAMQPSLILNEPLFGKMQIALFEQIKLLKSSADPLQTYAWISTFLCVIFSCRPTLVADAAARLRTLFLRSFVRRCFALNMTG
eukprot:TRINITY_DN10170_c0_g1_i2.p1 TRINITY_DN10170_c0_g1~~TRINITY_DN10170_c0_g1_i2.p1  ORF type:complete len:103 (+),score=14.19 TRINITY_DN10170_c0_g1_i2:139-447(+)